MKKKGSKRNALFFLVGLLLYSILYWITVDPVQVFGMILIALGCYILYKLEHKSSSPKELVKTKDVIYMCAGIVFDSLINGFPLSYLR